MSKHLIIVLRKYSSAAFAHKINDLTAIGTDMSLTCISISTIVYYLSNFNGSQVHSAHIDISGYFHNIAMVLFHLLDSASYNLRCILVQIVISVKVYLCETKRNCFAPLFC